MEAGQGYGPSCCPPPRQTQSVIKIWSIRTRRVVNLVCMNLRRLRFSLIITRHIRQCTYSFYETQILHQLFLTAQQAFTIILGNTIPRFNNGFVAYALIMIEQTSAPPQSIAISVTFENSSDIQLIRVKSLTRTT